MSESPSSSAPEGDCVLVAALPPPTRGRSGNAMVTARCVRAHSLTVPVCGSLYIRCVFLCVIVF